MPLAWKGGLVQQRQAEQRAADLAEAAAAPFSRYDIADDYEENLKSRGRFGDPMAHLAGRKTSRWEEPAPLVNKYNSAEMEKSGEQGA